jgi:hypothetical protein
MKSLAVSSTGTLSLAEARTYLGAAHADELVAALALAADRNILDGSDDAPDDTDVHHALYLLRRAQGLAAPSFDEMRVALRQMKQSAVAKAA